MDEEMGARLRSEREATGLSFTEFYRQCGVSKTAQFRFERGKQTPGGAYLIAADALGVDILYVLTGRKGAPLERTNTARASGGSVAVAGSNNVVTVAPLTRRRK
jgi:transcriptional regulator with XRE-family HTH domain